MRRLRTEDSVVTDEGVPPAALQLRDFILSLDDLVRDPLDAQIVQSALGRLSTALQAQAAAFFIRKGELLELLSMGGDLGASALPFLRSDGESAAALAMLKGDAVLYPASDASWSVLAAPVNFAGRPLGSMVLVRRGEGTTPFTPVDLTILAGFTDVVGRSIRREHLEAQLAEQLRKLERQDFRLFTINHVARVLGSLLELEELLRLIPDMVSEIINAESAIICLTQDEDNILATRSAKFLDPRRKAPEFRLVLSDGFQDWVRGFSGQMSPVLSVDDPQLESAFPQLKAEFTQSGLLHFTPMVYKDRLIGILAVGRKYTGEPYVERDFEFLSTLAPLASNAVANAQLYDLAIHDGTTGLFVSHYFRRRVTEELKRSRRYGFPVSVTMFDLDYFKQVNDTFGHLTGDQVLREMGHLLRRSSRRDIDVVARYGGEEFVLLLPETPQDGAVVVAERIRRSVEDFTFCGGRIQLTASGGVATFPDDAMSYEELVERADIQLYRAKRAGRNRVYAGDVEYSG